MLRISLLVTMAVVVIVDQVTKWMAVPALATEFQGKYYATRRIQIIPRCLDLMYAENRGGAFSVLQDNTWLITSIAFVMTIAISVWAFFLRSKPFIVQLALGLVIGGAIGNLIDRVRLQYVIDFIHAYVVIGGRERAWPTFNVADMAIMGGIGTLLYLSYATKLLDSVKSELDPLPENSSDVTAAHNHPPS